MQLIRTLHRRPSRPSAVTIGNFDGLHRGHQALIDRVVQASTALQAVLLCFEPLPRAVLHPERPVPRVMKPTDRIRIAARMGLDTLAQLRFDATFARMSPEDFVRRVLCEGLAARKVVIGTDFRFGHKAAGDAESLERLGRSLGFEVEVVPALMHDGQVISSTRVRQALATGDLQLAGQLLGRPYSISGRVLRGAGLGRKMGFATANLRPPLPPALGGILAARVHGAGLSAHPAVVSLGRRPTVNGRDWLLEVHLFDYSGDLYGRRIEVEFVHWLREEHRFASIEAMIEQMEHDANRARAVLEAAPSMA
ncbi:MAG: bifunctional riboflavin kinase/FAD synthetase [Wenzhouxiangellaceae bacterium]